MFIPSDEETDCVLRRYGEDGCHGRAGSHLSLLPIFSDNGCPIRAIVGNSALALPLTIVPTEASASPHAESAIRHSRTSEQEATCRPASPELSSYGSGLNRARLRGTHASTRAIKWVASVAGLGNDGMLQAGRGGTSGSRGRTSIPRKVSIGRPISFRLIIPNW